MAVVEMEHHGHSSMARTQQRKRGRGSLCTYQLHNIHLDMEAFEVALEGAKLVCVVHTSNVLGIRNPVEEIIEKSQAVGARVLLIALRVRHMKEFSSIIWVLILLQSQRIKWLAQPELVVFW